MELKSKNTKSLAIILISVITLFSNSAGLLMSKFVFNSPNEGDSLPQIFYFVCGFMILISIVGLIYGISIRNKK